MCRSFKTLLLAVALALAAGVAAAQAAAATYTWKNVRMDGGGFAGGIVFSRAQRDLIYARTDIGGMYRWEPATRTWTPLLDWVGWDRWGWMPAFLHHNIAPAAAGSRRQP